MDYVRHNVSMFGGGVRVDMCLCEFELMKGERMRSYVCIHLL